MDKQTQEAFKYYAVENSTYEGKTLATAGKIIKTEIEYFITSDLGFITAVNDEKQAEEMVGILNKNTDKSYIAGDEHGSKKARIEALRGVIKCAKSVERDTKDYKVRFIALALYIDSELTGAAKNES